VDAGGCDAGLLTAVIILGGVLSGVFTVTESAAAGAIWALLVTLLVYRALSWPDFLLAVRTSVRTTAVVFLLVGTATAFAWLLAMYRLPELLTEGMLSISGNPVVILIMINLCLLALGCVMDMAALILITTPIFLPVVVAIGMDPVQFGMVMMMNLGPRADHAAGGGGAVRRLRHRQHPDRGGDAHHLAVLGRDPGGAGAHHLLAGDVAHAAAAAAGIWRIAVPANSLRDFAGDPVLGLLLAGGAACRGGASTGFGAGHGGRARCGLTTCSNSTGS
jgi:hypothetical protein